MKNGYGRDSIYRKVLTANWFVNDKKTQQQNNYFTWRFSLTLNSWDFDWDWGELVFAHVRHSRDVFIVPFTFLRCRMKGLPIRLVTELINGNCWWCRHRRCFSNKLVLNLPYTRRSLVCVGERRCISRPNEFQLTSFLGGGGRGGEGGLLAHRIPYYLNVHFTYLMHKNINVEVIRHFRNYERTGYI